MQTGAGTIALIAVGVIIVAVGGYHIYKGASHNFLDDLKGRSSDLARRLGMLGYVAKAWLSPVPGCWSSESAEGYRAMDERRAIKMLLTT